MALKRIFILGSTGSIGINTLNVIERFSDQFQVVGLTAYSNVVLLERQVKKFLPKYVAVHPQGFRYLKQRFNGRLKICDVENDLADLVALKEVDVVVIGISGSAALAPFLSAVRSGKTVAPANKEALVIAGDILMKEAKRANAKIIPVDSEQSAIFQCLDGKKREELKKVFLTASGGPLLNIPSKKFNTLSIKQILRHPRWKMGKKISVDSATLMNKGFEIIEAKHLFHLAVKEIEVVIHPEAIIHSMVEFQDGSIMAQLGVTDMRLPIQYALTYPHRFKSNLKETDFYQLKHLTFDRPDVKKFPSLKLAQYVAERGGTLPAVLNAADEVAVQKFLEGKISFMDIHKIVEKVVLSHRLVATPTLNDILKVDQIAREEAQKLVLN